MNMNDVTDKFKPLADEFTRLQADNERLKAQLADSWRHQQLASNLQREVSDLKAKLERASTERDHYWNDAYHWKLAVRYEQAIKRPRKVIRHLPILGSVNRAKRRDTKAWIGCRTNAERIMLKRWRAENKRVPGTNGGRGVLEIIVSEDNDAAAPLTQRDATVAATVIQWLGTNCGRCFLEQCEREIKTSIEKERRDAKVGAA